MKNFWLERRRLKDAAKISELVKTIIGKPRPLGIGLLGPNFAFGTKKNKPKGRI